MTKKYVAVVTALGCIAAFNTMGVFAEESEISSEVSDIVVSEEIIETEETIISVTDVTEEKTVEETKENDTDTETEESIETTETEETEETTPEETEEESKLITGTCGEFAVYNYNEDTCVLLIKGKGIIEERWVENHQDIADEVEQIIIEEGITGIDTAAFKYMPNLESVQLPASLVVLSDNVFYGCSDLRDIQINSVFESVGHRVFRGTIFAKETADEYGFLYAGGILCDCIVRDELPSSIDYVVPEGTHSIVSDVLADNKDILGRLKSISFPESLRSIGDTAFAYTSLNSVTIPVNVTYVGNNAFMSCKQLKLVTFNGCPNYVGYAVFQDCIALEDVDLGAVKEIGGSFFEGCSSLKQITLPNELRCIPYSCFEKCTNLETVVISSSVSEISKSAFRDCTHLESINLDDVISIEPLAFANCVSLNHINFNMLACVKSRAFLNCCNLTDIKFNKAIILYEGSFIGVPAQRVEIYYDLEHMVDTDIKAYAFGYAINPNMTDNLRADLYSTYKPFTAEMLVKQDNIVIAGLSQTNAEMYAKNNGFTFESTGEFPLVMGDVSLNGIVTSDDALSILQYIVGGTDLTELQLQRADIDGDGELTSADALKVLQIVVGI